MKTKDYYLTSSNKIKDYTTKHIVIFSLVLRLVRLGWKQHIYFSLLYKQH